MLLSESITTLPFIGKSYASKLARLGIFTIKDLLYFFPRTYHDSRLITPIVSLDNEDQKYTVFATVDSIKNIRTRSRRLTIQKATIHDDSGSINVTWFNQPFLSKTLKEGTSAYFMGKLNPRSLIPELMAPAYDIENDAQVNAARIVPVYNLTSGISSKWLRKRIYDLIAFVGAIEDFSDSITNTIQTNYNLMPLKEALTQIHFPESKPLLIEARKRLAFDELLDIQKRLLLRKKKLEKTKVAPWQAVDFAKTQISKDLSFNLTPTQLKCTKDIATDLSSGHIMNRLVQGDVGSGKTLMAFYAAEIAISNGKQAIMMAPTSVLAQQHYDLALRLFNKNTKIGLITSNTTKKLSKPPKLDLIIGTHAVLYHKSKLIKDLGLVIIDEEHRFGVEQRNDIIHFHEANQAVRPHYLSLTATPIPRSIALTLFGDMDVSIIQKPSERKPVKTFIVPQSKRDDSYAWIKQEVKDGNQVFWICPLIEENPDLEAKSVKQVSQKLSKIFGAKSVRLLHGKIKPAEKDKILDDFKKHKYNILVSTTVIEVGIDIPNANLIVIEDAERFGLAQLHQLRGRVGRSEKDAWCLLFSTATKNTPSLDRLKYFASETDGNKIAEYDLHLRGPGEVYGNIQSGIPNLKVARFSNSELLLQTREVALQLI